MNLRQTLERAATWSVLRTPPPPQAAHKRMRCGLPAVWLSASPPSGEVGICAAAAGTLFLSILETPPYAGAGEGGLTVGFLGDLDAAARCEGVSLRSEHGRATAEAALVLDHWLEARLELRRRAVRRAVMRLFDQALVPLYFVDIVEPEQALRRLRVPDRGFVDDLAAGLGLSPGEHASVRAGWA